MSRQWQITVLALCATGLILSAGSGTTGKDGRTVLEELARRQEKKREVD